ncbi:MAG: alanine racemase [Eubacteriales bacterium]
METYTTFRSVAEVNLSHIRENLMECMKLIPDGVKPVGVVKADAYGHGALRTAGIIYDLVDAFAVATVDEALELKSAGYETPIYILGYAHPSSYKILIENDIIPAIFKWEDAAAFSEVAEKLGVRARINIKVDTGMGRIGFPAGDESAKLVKKIADLPGLRMYGLFMHFATADQADKTFAECQFERFNCFIGKCHALGVDFENITCANSAAVLEMPQTAKTEMRVGIALYGYLPSAQVVTNAKLKPALVWKSHIAFVKEVEAGESIGYGQTYVADSRRRIATVPVGYADGYPRSLSNKGRVRIGSGFAPVVGRVCMDMFMVDITDLPDARDGDEVILIGEGVSADDLAALTGTISYEILCGISKRVPRVYVK